MTRRLVIWHHVILVVLIFWMIHDERQVIVDYRQNHPSNEKLLEATAQFEGAFTGFRYANDEAYFKTSEGLIFVREIPESAFEDLLSSDSKGVITVSTSKAQWNAQKNFGVFDYDRYLYSKGVVRVYSFDAFEADVKQRHSFTYYRNQIYLSVLKMPYLKLKQTLGALFFGDTNALAEYDDYKRLGILHLFTVSGLHFGVVFLFLRQVLRVGNDTLRQGVLLIVMWLFYLLIGGGIASLRALFMIVYALLAAVFKRPVDPITMMAFSNLGILWLEPYALFSTSYYLSFYAYIGVAYLVPQWTKRTVLTIKHERLRKAIRLLKQYILLQLYLVPMTLYVFHETNVLSFLANALMIPIYSLLMPFFIVDTLLIGVFPEGILTKGISYVLNVVLEVLSQVTAHLPSLMIEGYYFTSSDLWLLVAIFLICTMILAFRRLRPLYPKAMPWLLIFVLAIFMYQTLPKAINANLHISALDVAHGDATLIEYQDLTILIDSGSAYAHIEDILEARQIRDIDYCIITHAHEDHYGGLLALSKKIEINTVMCLSEVSDVLESKGLELSYVQPPKTLSYGPLTFTFETHADANDPNDNAILTVLSYKTFTAVFTGDLSGQALEEMQLPDDIDLYKLPHHGSETGYSEALVRTHDLCVGYTSHSRKYLMPSEHVTALYEENGVPIWDTFYHGAMNFTIDASHLVVEDYFGNRQSYTYDDVD